MKAFRVKGKRILISHVGGTLYAIDDICSHDEGPLNEGTIHGDEVECPRHGARFSLRTGAVLSMPAVTPVKAYKIRVDGQNVQMDVDA